MSNNADPAPSLNYVNNFEYKVRVAVLVEAVLLVTVALVTVALLLVVVMPSVDVVLVVLSSSA